VTGWIRWECLAWRCGTEGTVPRWPGKLSGADGAPVAPVALPKQSRHAKQSLAADGEMYRAAKELVDNFAKSEAIEGFRVFSVRELVKQRGKLRDALDQFAEAQRHQVESWDDVNTPGVLDAASAVIDRAAVSVGRALGAAGEGLLRISESLVDKSRDEEVVDKPAGPDDNKR
jgi:hypothetical protein